MRRISIGCAALLVVWGLGSAVNAAWVVIEVPLLPSWVGGVEVRDVNTAGIACGMGNYVINTSSTPFIFDGVTVTELPFLYPPDPIGLVTGINNHNVVCGYAHNDEADSQAVFWDGSGLHEIPYPPDANTNSDFRAYGINDDGVIVGYFWNTNGERTAFYYDDGVTYSLDAAIRAASLTGLQLASAVNNNNVICGVADDPLGVSTPYTFDIATQTLTVLGRLGPSDCSATDINDAGQTIGRGKFYDWDTYIHAVTYDGSWHFVDNAETATQWGQSINDAGRMVGNSGTGDNRVSWYSDAPGDGSIRYVSLPGWTRVTAQSVNNRNWMAGYGLTASSGGEERGFVVRPPLGDGDYDNDIDMVDFATFAACLSGPIGGPAFAAPSAECLQNFDFAPADGDVDLTDFAAFQRAFEGP